MEISKSKRCELARKIARSAGILGMTYFGRLETLKIDKKYNIFLQPLKIPQNLQKTNKNYILMNIKHPRMIIIKILKAQNSLHRDM